MQQDDYYPFGLEINPLTNSPKNEYLYNKKELQEEIQQYDYGARFYDPVIGRWLVVDAYAEPPDQIHISPYVYVGNNPINVEDPDGNCPPCDVPDDVPLFDRMIGPAVGDRPVEHPTQAAIHDFAYNALDFLGVKGLINAIGDLGNKKIHIDQKVAGMVSGLINLVPIDGEGEREPNIRNRPKIEILPENKINRELLNSPKEHGKGPTFKKDGKPVDIHHQGQKAEGPFHERHPDNHRSNGSYRTNHPNGQKPLTKAERQQFNKAKREYWKKEYPSK